MTISSMFLLQICVNIFILGGKFVQGVTLVIRGGTTRASLNYPFTFTCTVSHSAGVTGAVDFYRRNNSSVAVIASIFQRRSTCYVDPYPRRADVEAACGAGTNSSDSDTKVYTLTLYRVTANDTASWSCRMNRVGKRSRSVRLHLKKSGVTHWRNTLSVINSFMIIFELMILAFSLSSSPTKVTCANKNKRSEGSSLIKSFINPRQMFTSSRGQMSDNDCRAVVAVKREGFFLRRRNSFCEIRTLH